MNHLVILAHPNPQSFSHAIADTVVRRLEAAGHTVRVRDLYALGFSPVLQPADFVAFKAGQIPADIAAEQEELRWAEGITVVAPVWWTGLPAILKGYFDRVFSYGFAYAYGPQGKMGLLAGRKVLLFSCHGHPFDVYQDMGMHEALRQTSDEGIWRFSGVEVAAHVFFGAVPSTTPEVRAGYLAEAAAVVDRVFI